MGFRRNISNLFAPGATCLVLVLLWQATVQFGFIPNFLVPTPVQVVQALVKDAPLIAEHSASTLIEALVGLFAGAVLGAILALLMDRFELLYKAFEPLITISQTIPTVAIAPLLVLWFGYGLLPKVLLVILTTFFPITVALVAGLKSQNQDVLDLFQVMGARRWQVFWYAKLPEALDHLFSGLKISVTYAVVAAVVAEWLGGSSGLGVYMTRVRKSFAYDRMFAAILVISVLSLALMALFGWLQKRLMPWKYIYQEDQPTSTNTAASVPSQIKEHMHETNSFISHETN